MHADAGDQFAAVHRQAVRQHEHAGKIVGGERPPDGLAMEPGVPGILRRRDRRADCGRFETDRDGVDSAFDDFVAADLTAGRASHQACVGKHLAQFTVARGVGERFTAAEIENQTGREPDLLRLPLVDGIPTQ